MMNGLKPSILPDQRREAVKIDVRAFDKAGRGQKHEKVPTAQNRFKLLQP